MKFKVHVAIALAVVGGIFSAYAYVNPYNSEIPLSELVLQLSGSRGEFPFGCSIPELVSMIMCMVPIYVFQL